MKNWFFARETKRLSIRNCKLNLQNFEDRLVPSTTPVLPELTTTAINPTVDTVAISEVAIPVINSESIAAAATPATQFNTLLKREFSKGINLFIHNPVGNYIYPWGPIGTNIPQASPPAGSNGPLQQYELDRLNFLIKGNIDNPETKNLLNRMQNKGIAFDGRNELGVLRKIMSIVPPAQKPALKIGITTAINGLQKIANAQYKTYKQARDAGASHEDAWTYNAGGDAAFRRYELEKIATER